MSRFLRACRLEPTDCTPVWFMRQAGRIFPEYRALRRRVDFLTLCRTPDLAAEVTLMPVRRLGVDAAIVFADIMLVPGAMGIAYRLAEGTGPVLPEPLRDPRDLRRLREVDPEGDLGFVLETIRLCRRELAGRVPVIGFAGGPFTLACYLIEGRPAREFHRAKQAMFAAPDLWHGLLARLADATLAYLRAQVMAGADAVMLFDSWAGILAPWDYREFVLPYSRRVLEGLAELGVPRIHFGTGTATLLPLLAEAGAEVVGVDWRIGLDEAWAAVGHGRAVQGNLDPAVLLGPWELIEGRAADVLRRAGGRPGHIFNVGHGLLPDTPLGAVRRLVEWVHEHTARAAPGWHNGQG